MRCFKLHRSIATAHLCIGITFFFICFLSCQSKAKNTISEKKSAVVQDSCIFDQSTQTDAFLKGIADLENYSWNQEEKTAEIVLNDHWGLTIYRGGCVHFTLNVTFLYDRHLDFESNRSMVFDQMVWISDLLAELNADEVRSALKDERFTIEQIETDKFVLEFTTEALSNYFFNYQTWNDATRFDFGKQID